MIKTIEMTEAIIEAKFPKGASWADISKAAGISEVFVVSACLGQNTLPAEALPNWSSTLISVTARKM
jgi:cyanate lyase